MRVAFGVGQPKQLPLACAFVHAADRYFEDQRPDLILANEPNSTLGPFVDVAIAHGVPVVQFIQPSRDDAMVFKRLNRVTRRIHANSVAPEVLEPLTRELWTPQHQQALDEEFRRLARRWFVLGWPAFLAVGAIFWLMIRRPA